MIVNVDDVFTNRPKMKFWLYFTLIAFAFVVIAYRKGSQSPSLIVEALWIVSLTLVIANYKRFLSTQDLPALKKLLVHPDMSDFTRPILMRYLKYHYTKDSKTAPMPDHRP